MIINIDYCKDRFYSIKYEEFDIIMCKETKYINMSKIVKLDPPKHLEYWFNTITSQAVLDNIEEEIPYITINDTHNKYRGRYCHKKLIPYILAWCSDKFLMRCVKEVNIIRLCNLLEEAVNDNRSSIEI